MTMNTVLVFLDTGREQVRTGDLALDLSGVTSVDSAALAAIFEWQRCAGAAGHRLILKNVPPALSSLAELHGVSELLQAE